jgi:integrase
MRNGEIASLRWEDFDGDCIRLRVENAKNGTARLLPLEGDLVQPIEWRKAARQVKGNGKGSMSALIFHRTGERIREFRKSWAIACRLAGVRRLFHD